MVVEATSTQCLTSGSKLSSVISPDVSTHTEVCHWEDKATSLSHFPSDCSGVTGLFFYHVCFQMWRIDLGRMIEAPKDFFSNVHLPPFPAIPIRSTSRKWESPAPRGLSLLFVCTWAQLTLIVLTLWDSQKIKARDKAPGKWPGPPGAWSPSHSPAACE